MTAKPAHYKSGRYALFKFLRKSKVWLVLRVSQTGYPAPKPSGAMHNHVRHFDIAIIYGKDKRVRRQTHWD